MKRLRFLLFLTLSFLLTSCIDVIEEVFLNGNGSGRYTLTLDMSDFFSDPMMKSMLKEALLQDSTLNLSDLSSLETDTTISFANLPAERRAKLDDPDFWKKVTMRTVMSEKKGEMKTTIELNFTDVKDINYLYANLDELSEEGNSLSGSLADDGGLLPSGALFDLNRRTLTRRSAPSGKAKAANDEEMEMMKMFLASATYRTIYHLPGRVTKTTIPDAKVDGKTVTFESGLLDMMENKGSVNGDIKFKKR